VKNNLIGLLTSENQIKYRMQVQNSIGVYLDGYSRHKPGAPFGYYMEPIGGSRVRHLGINLKQAMQVADEFVWFWGEKGCWVSKKRKTWKDMMPGLHETLLSMKSPGELGRNIRIRMEKGELKNDCSGTVDLGANQEIPEELFMFRLHQRLFVHVPGRNDHYSGCGPDRNA
jgi:hypothetical protein